MNIAIVDDETFFLDMVEQSLRSCLSKIGMSGIVIDRFSSGAEFLEHWAPMSYQLIFLDIYMDTQNGVDVARCIRESDSRAALIFCTTSNEFAAQSYEVNASYYLRKPVSEENMMRVLQRINISQINQKQQLELPDGFRCILYDIEYTSYNNHVVTFVFASSDPHQIYMSQADLEALLLAHQDFTAVNRGTVVNLRMVERLESTALYTKSGEYIPISRSKQKAFAQLFAEYKLKKMEELMG